MNDNNGFDNDDETSGNVMNSGAHNFYLNDESNLLLANFNDTDNMFNKNVSRYLKPKEAATLAVATSVNYPFVNEANITATNVNANSSLKQSGSTKINHNFNDKEDDEDDDELLLLQTNTGIYYLTYQ